MTRGKGFIGNIIKKKKVAFLAHFGSLIGQV
jgi:hypothetical protein